MIVHQSLIDVDGRALDKAHQVSGHCPSDRDIVNSRLFKPIPTYSSVFAPPGGVFSSGKKTSVFVPIARYCQPLPAYPPPLFLSSRKAVRKDKNQDSLFTSNLQSTPSRLVQPSPTYSNTFEKKTCIT